MKKLFVAILLGINLISYGQASVKSFKNKKVKITYFNLCDSELTYFNPYIFLSYDKKRKRLYIRRDRLQLQNDTLIIFLNDTSISEIGLKPNTWDNFLKEEGKWKSITLLPKDSMILEIYFKPKFNYSKVKVYYTMNSQLKIAWW